jgi:hypothetical protein
MTRTEAVQRINEGIGFRAAGNPLEATIIRRLQEAQRDLEKGKTLPRFLIQEDQPLVLAAGTHTTPLPPGFLRDVDETGIRFYAPNSIKARFLKRAYYKDAIQASAHVSEMDPSEPIQRRAPQFYVIRRTVIDFITIATTTYNLVWDYYKAAALLTTDTENEWLRYAPEWLIGEAGLRLAQSLGNQQALAEFTAVRQAGRAAIFGEDLAAELSSGPLAMGANQ